MITDFNNYEKVDFEKEGYTILYTKYDSVVEYYLYKRVINKENLGLLADFAFNEKEIIEEYNKGPFNFIKIDSDAEVLTQKIEEATPIAKGFIEGGISLHPVSDYISFFSIEDINNFTKVITKFVDKL